MMNQFRNHYDVAIVGASVAGCTAAMLFARQGLSVALIERNPDIDAYKKVCTHFIQPTATPTLKRLGLDQAIEAAGGVRNSIEVWTRWGWVPSAGDQRFYGYNIRRQTLDPLLRRQAAATPNVDFLPGISLRALIFAGERVVGLRGEGQGQLLDIRAGLVVGADGRHSRTAELAGLAAEIKPNHRFSYFAYFRNLSLSSGRRSQMWLLDPAVAYAMPNEDNLTVVGLMLPKSELKTFKSDIEGNFRRYLENLPDGPNLREAEQVSAVRGMIDMPNISRPKWGPGVALIGDAALASDPLWGIGCGWAFQSASWLVEATAKALASGDQNALDKAMNRYQARHHKTLADRAARFADFSRARPFNFIERLMYAAAAREPRFARYTGPYQSYPTSLTQLPPLKVLAQALWLNLSQRGSRLAAALPGRGDRPRFKSGVYKHQGV